MVLILADQHHAAMVGHPHVSTPALDRLAASGILFSGAYSTSPVGTVARTGISTGRYPTGRRSPDDRGRRAHTWAHALSAAGYRVTTVGDLHAGAVGDPGVGDRRLSTERAGIVRGHPSTNAKPGESERRAEHIGPGEAPYSRFDRAVTAAAVGFLGEEDRSQPWALTVSLAAPHFPTTVPREFFGRYDDESLKVHIPEVHPTEPWVDEALSRGCPLGGVFSAEDQRRSVRASLALCSFLDSKVGQLLDAVERSGHRDDTLVIYTSGHGASGGAHGPWCRAPLSEEALRVPLLVAGPGIPGGHRVETPVSHVDIAATIRSWAGVASSGPESPGVSVVDAGRLAADRAVMAEHVSPEGSGAMLRWRRMKYVERPGRRAQLFDLVADPYERFDLASDPDHQNTLAECGERLRALRDTGDGFQGSRPALVG